MALKNWLSEQGFDSVHTRELPLKNLSPDSLIIKLALKENRIVVTKDSDFFEYLLLHKYSFKILMITTGNIVNKKLIALFEKNFHKAQKLLTKHKVVEINNSEIVVHF